jgi:hypothetical protein
MGDLFPPTLRAMSVFMMDAARARPRVTSARIAQASAAHGVYLAAIRVLCACRARHPRTGARHARKRKLARAAGRSPFKLILGIPTLWWVIASGALQLQHARSARSSRRF